MLLEKIVGAAAEQGRSLAEVADLAMKVNDNGRIMGMALTSCTVPAAGKPTFELAENEMEVGIGIHGEPGRTPVAAGAGQGDRRAAGRPGARRPAVRHGDAVIAFMNGMGGTPLIELYLMYNEVKQLLDRAGITVARSLVGNYITSLEMAGCSVTLLKADDELVGLWDAPVNTPGLRWGA